jgi:hypothetical protein
MRTRKGETDSYLIERGCETSNAPVDDATDLHMVKACGIPRLGRELVRAQRWPLSRVSSNSRYVFDAIIGKNASPRAL